jgi:hypothetical protein
MLVSFETENAVEIKYDDSACEYTVICACREPEQRVKNDTRNDKNKNKRTMPWTILSVVVIDAIHNKETMHSDLTGRMSWNASTTATWPLQSRTPDSHRHLSPLHVRGRQSALDAHRSFSRLALESSAGGVPTTTKTTATPTDRTRSDHGRWIVSSSLWQNNNTVTPRASGRTRQFHFMPASGSSVRDSTSSASSSHMLMKQQHQHRAHDGNHKSVRHFIVFDKDTLAQAQELKHRKSSFKL